ncbi:hypothetical protein [Antarctobacter heliothermus]|uniref:Uncharacterized protein n=1 Tax=Antarctobacter heliothermus TaxID=74033 RepID=A0A239D350_9RHOB|nr:hypothetical protein [Antarctobacter heliothermus]SNS26727.1 hypothetical protein SAMN04488078_100951 [Antarctobacter heliothermus]
MPRRLNSAVALCALALAAGGGIAQEPGSEAWNAQRATLFSQVCMASAPDYDDIDDRAKAAGMARQDGVWVAEPEIVINLIEHDGFCDCIMSVSAPDQRAMIDKVFAQLMADFGAEFTGAPDGLASVAPFQRDGIEVVSILEPRSYEDGKWLSARTAVFGKCPIREAGK